MQFSSASAWRSHHARPPVDEGEPDQDVKHDAVNSRRTPPTRQIAGGHRQLPPVAAIVILSTATKLSIHCEQVGAK